MLTQEQINQDWTVRSDNYNRYVEEEFATERPAKWLERIEKNAPSGRPLKILDAGCGPGFFSVLLSRAGHQVTGIDGSEGMLEHARENARRFEVVPELVQGDFGDLPFADNTFDLVISRNVTHIIRNHLKVYGEWLRVLKPNGVLLIFDANWHLPYQPGSVREEAIRRERLGLEKYHSGYTYDGSYEYIDSELNPETTVCLEKHSALILIWECWHSFHVKKYLLNGMSQKNCGVNGKNCFMELRHCI